MIDETRKGWFYRRGFRSAHYFVPGMPRGVSMCGKRANDTEREDVGMTFRRCTDCTRELKRREREAAQ